MDGPDNSPERTGPSPEALAAVTAFKTKHWEEYRLRMPADRAILPQLIYFLTDYFDLEIDPDILPDHENNESAEEEKIRESVVSRLTVEFWEREEWLRPDPDDYYWIGDREVWPLLALPFTLLAWIPRLCAPLVSWQACSNDD